MKTLHLIPLIFITSCSTTPRLALRLQQPPAMADNSTVRYPEVIHAYHVGRYADPSDDLVMHEQHVIYRVEENTRWNLHPASRENSFLAAPDSRNAAFSPLPVNDAVLAEVNAQKLATVQIIMEAKVLSSALAQFQVALQQTRTNLQETAVLRTSVIEMEKRLDALEATPAQTPAPLLSTTNEPSDSLSP